ncbi:ribonuclease domain-containing protein, partial [Helicobacter cinaedi]
KRTYNIDNNTFAEQEALQAINHLQIYLKAYYNQDTIPNKDKQSNKQKQAYKEQKTQTKWGYILFDKDKDIDSTLKELTKDSTIPLTKLKEFIRITKEYCPTNNNIKNTHTESTTHTTQANTSHIHNNPTSIDSKSTNNTSKDSNITESKDYLLGEEIDIYYKEEWQDKQVRFFAYIESPKSDVGVDIELQEISYTIMYDEDKEDKLFLHKDSRIDWVDVAIEVISLIPLARGVRIALNIGKWGLKLLRGNANIAKKARAYTSKRLAIKDKKDKQNKKTESKPIKEVKLHTLPKETQETYHNYKAHKWQGMYPGQGKGVSSKNEVRAGKTFKNKDFILPQKPEGTYKRFDISNRHSAGRFVRDMESGDVYYTKDHYETFVKIIE